MELDNKVVAAISAGVTSYIQAEKTARHAAQPQAARHAANEWSRSGRQEIMRNRQLWQLRIVPR